VGDELMDLGVNIKDLEALFFDGLHVSFPVLVDPLVQ